jgi:hypothetical protein
MHDHDGGAPRIAESRAPSPIKQNCALLECGARALPASTLLLSMNPTRPRRQPEQWTRPCRRLRQQQRIGPWRSARVIAFVLQASDRAIALRRRRSMRPPPGLRRRLRTSAIAKRERTSPVCRVPVLNGKELLGSATVSRLLATRCPGVPGVAARPRPGASRSFAWFSSGGKDANGVAIPNLRDRRPYDQKYPLVLRVEE